MDAAVQMGELVEVRTPVSRDEEMSGVAYLAGKREGSPALLFSSIEGFPGARMLWNMHGSSLPRLCLTLGLPPTLSRMEAVQAFRNTFRRRIPPEEVEPGNAPLFQNSLLGDDVDLTKLPGPKHWPLDGGYFIGTNNAVITRDPETGRLNVGTYRNMIHSARELGIYFSPGKDGLLHMEAYWRRGQACPIAVCLGVTPQLAIVGGLGFPKNVPEYEVVGGIIGRPLRLVRARTTDLLLPADAEVVVEGFIRPNHKRTEGPFGEFTGYYGRPPGPAPVIDVTAIHFRTDPVYTAALMADYPACEAGMFFSVARSARIWNDLETMGIPGVRGVYCYPAAAAGYSWTVISLEQRYAGHAAQTLALAAQCPGGAYYGKWYIVVDDDVDPSNIDDVLWALSTRCNPVDDVDILRNTWSTWLDPTQNPPEKRPYGSKALINACKEHRYLRSFAKRTAMRRSIYEQIRAKWASLGLNFAPPELTVFEAESPDGEVPA